MEKDFNHGLTRMNTDLTGSNEKGKDAKLEQHVGQAAAPVSGELYGEPLTDEDIEQSARVAFQMLDEEETLQT